MTTVHPKVDLEVIGSRAKAKITALIDTGFTGYVSLPIKIAKDLGLELCGEEEYELATGQWLTHPTFLGKVNFLGKIQEVELILSDSETSLIGTLLLADCRMTIDFLANDVQLSRIDI